MTMADHVPTPVDPSASLKRPLEGEHFDEAHPPQRTPSGDSAVTKAKQVARIGSMGIQLSSDGPSAKKVKIEDSEEKSTSNSRIKVHGVALVKPEYLIDTYKRSAKGGVEDDDAAEGRPQDARSDHRDSRDGGGKKKDKKKKERGQNKDRQFGQWFDAIRLCSSRANSPEFSPKDCRFGDKCSFSHDLRQYLKEGKTGDLHTFEGQCPVWKVNGKCHAGWKCRFAGSHSNEIEYEDGRKELVLVEDPTKFGEHTDENDESRRGIYNVVGTQDKLALAKRKMNTDKAEQYAEWLEKDAKEMDKIYHKKKDRSHEENGVSDTKMEGVDADQTAETDQSKTEHAREATEEAKQDNRAQFVDPPFLPSEKRRIYFGPETPALAPLTTQGNLPFRRMCVDFGAQITYSEMALSMPLIQGTKAEWALMKAHESELSPPRYIPKSIVQGYDNTKDLKFGAQISANKPWNAMKAAEVMTKLLPHLRVIDLNCGCPIELVCRQGAGSALLDSTSKLEKMIRGMNAVSGEIPITAKIRMGTRDAKPTADKIIERLAFGGHDTRERLGAPGCAALTLHGRSKQQRYTKSADWSYIADCAALIKSYNVKKDTLTDTIHEPDARTQANTSVAKMFFIGNGDCYSHIQYQDAIQNSGVDSVMVARGALIKPWLFEEIESGQYLDKSASERLGYVERFSKYGLEAWGSDEVGVGTTRKFLLEWLSFAHRYVPVGILDHLPPSLQDRPPAYRGRNELETLLASDNYLDWIKISEMFLGPAHKDFKFQPKHKSNSYEIEAEG